MKNDKPEPARVLSKPGAGQENEENQGAATVPPPGASAAGTVNPGDQTPTQADQTEVSFLQAIFNPVTEKTEGYWETPYTMLQKGKFAGIHKLSLQQVAINVRGFTRTAFDHFVLWLGYYLNAFYFDNDEKKMSSKNRYKDVSVNDLARQIGGRFNRQFLSECMKIAFTDLYFRNNDFHAENLNIDHLRELARVKDKKARLSIAKRANKDNLSPEALKMEIDAKLGKILSEDKRIAQAVSRQLKDFIRISKENNIKEILSDKGRLKAALSTTESAELLQSCEAFSAEFEKSKEIVEACERTLLEIQVDKMKLRKPTP